MFKTLTLIVLAGLAAAGSAQAATFQFSYQAAAGTISGRLSGSVQADGNTIFLKGLASPLRFNGAAGAPLPVFFTASTLYGVDRQPAVTFDGSYLDFAACADGDCSDGVLFDPDTIDVAPVVSVGTSYGDFREYSDPSLWSISAVPDTATWMLMLGGFSLVGSIARRRKSVVAA